MNKFVVDISKDYKGNIIGLEYNEELFSPVIAKLYKNNTFCPAIKNIIKNGSFTKVFFVDGTSSSVRRSPKDSDDIGAAVAFAVFKRLVGVPDAKGDVDGSGFAAFLKKTLDKVHDQAAYNKQVNEERANKKAEKISKGKAPKNSKKVKKSTLPPRDSKGHFIKH